MDYLLTYLDLDLVPPVLIRTLGDELSPSGTVVGSISRVIPTTPSMSRSSFSVDYISKVYFVNLTRNFDDE